MINDDKPFQHVCWLRDCAQVSHTAQEAYEHWRTHQHRIENQPIVSKGERVTVILKNGTAFTDVVTDYDIDEETGEHRMTVGKPKAGNMVHHGREWGDELLRQLGLPTEDAGTLESDCQ